MDWRRPFAVVSPGAVGAVYEALTSNMAPLSGRDVARRAGISPQGALEVLNRLTRAGIVTREDRPAVSYRLNAEHVAYRAVLELGELRSEAFRRMATDISGWKVACENATVFGSVARGEATDESDVDLLVVRSRRVDADDARWTDQIGDLAAQVRRWTGNDLSVVEVDIDGLRATGTTMADVVAEAARDGVVVGGAPLRVLLTRRARPSRR